MVEDKFNFWWEDYGPEYLEDLEPIDLARIAFKCGYLKSELEKEYGK